MDTQGMYEKILELEDALAKEQTWANIYARESRTWFEEAVKAKRDLLRLVAVSDKLGEWVNHILDEPDTCYEYKQVVIDFLSLIYELKGGRECEQS